MIDADKILPVDKVLPQIVDALRQGPAVVVQAPTGSGKTTRVPPGLLASGLLGRGRLLMLQPRRVAARACAQAMAHLAGEQVGQTVGYQIRFERRLGKQTRILVVTEGILTRKFAADPMLEGISCVVLDEFHERSLHLDLALAFLKELLGLRDDLKVVVMSATLAAEQVAAFLGNCPVVTAAGRAYPLAISYQPYSPKDPLGLRVETALKTLLNDPADDGGHVLVFLPGAPEIRRVAEHLSLSSFGEIVPLHGSLSAQEQDYALATSKQRRIILATNIAETSLTIEGVTAVIDSGLRKALTHDSDRGFDRLDVIRISRAGATQRAGRAGRVAPGRAIRLWGEDYHAMMKENELPQIANADLTGMLLAVLDFHGPNLEAFPFYEEPPEKALDAARSILQMIGATDKTGRLTDLGRRLGNLPLHPRVAVILDRAAARGQGEQAAWLCALLGERLAGGPASLFEQFQMLTGEGRPPWEHRVVRRIKEACGQLAQQVRGLAGGKKSMSRNISADEVAGLVLAGYPDRLCCVRNPGQAVMVGGRGISYEVDPTAAPFQYFLALDLMERGVDRTAGKAGRIAPLSLDRAARVIDLEQEETAVFHEEREAVSGVRRTRFKDLILLEKPVQNVAGEALAQVLARAASERFERVFKPDKEAQALLWRLRFAAQHLPEQSWPDLSDEGIRKLLPQLCVGLRNFAQIRKLNWKNAFLNALPWQLRSCLDEQVPERFQVPSGTNVRIDYQPAFTDTGYPVLAVRLQEVFGLADGPRVARGRVPILLHLLAPNMRPAQVTRDLRGFWDRTYAEVRKELRQRYPKHHWPEDPWTAQAVRER